MATRCVSVVIADRHPVVLCGLTSMLHAESDFNVVASCRDAATCIKAIRDLSPHLVLLDMSQPGLDGLEVLTTIKLEQLRTRLVYLSAFCDSADVVTAVARGAYGFIPKEAAPQFVVRCLRQVASGSRILPRVMWDRQPRNRNGDWPSARGGLESPPSLLTERECQIMHLVSEGLSNKEVGRHLNVSDGTIKVHLHHIYQKLAIHNRTALAALAASLHDFMPFAI